MKKFLPSILNVLPIIAIIGIWIVVVRANYTAGTSLYGWDNLVPEFNLGLNIKRSLTAVWQEYQGVGLLGGMSHAADLPRQLILALISIVVPMQSLRYLWTFAMLLIGPLGAYALSALVTKSKPASLAAAVFYLLNIATVQYFYTPYESFISFFGFLPWLLWGAMRFLSIGKKKNLLLFIAISFLAASAFYVQTLFVVYLILLAIIGVEVLMREKLSVVKRVSALIFAVIVANAFWLLPAAYFTITNADVVVTAKGNALSTEETALMNKGFGRLTDVMQLKGYWFEYTDGKLDDERPFGYLMQPWREYLAANPFATMGSYSLSVIAFVGAIIALFKRKNKVRFAPLGMLLISVLLLSNMLDLSAMPLVGQAFRSAFTKWSIAASLSFSLGIAFFVASVMQLLPKIAKLVGSILLAGAILITSAIAVRPIFEGQLISPAMRVQLPSAYLDLFDYFKTQPKQSRIAFFPVQSFWGWNFYDWGYRGSGFLWYGIEQPILDRAFDVWSRENETFYHEVSTAIYANDADQLKEVLDKYDVTYALIDQSVTIPAGKKEQLGFEETEKLFNQIGANVVWQKDFLSVYQVGEQSEFVYAPQTYSTVFGRTTYARQDALYEQFGDYITINGKQALYPFSNLSAERADNITYQYSIDGDKSATIKRDAPADTSYELVIPAIKEGILLSLSGEVRFYGNTLVIVFDPAYEVFAEDTKVTQFQPDGLSMVLPAEYSAVIASFGNQQITIQKDEVKQFRGITLDPTKTLEVQVFNGFGKYIETSNNFATLPVNTCWSRDGGNPIVDAKRSNDILSIQTTDAVGCMAFKLGDFKTDAVLLTASLPYQSQGAARPHFCITVEGAPDCLTDDIFYHSTASASWTTIDRILQLSPASYWMVISARPPEEQGNSWTINYKNPTVVVYPKILTATYAPTLWSQITKEQRLPIAEEIKSLSVTFSTDDIDVNLATSGRPQAFNCDLFKRGNVTKDIQESKVTYSAAGRGASCDFAVLGELDSTQSYVMRITGENTAGRSAKVYLFNKATNRNDIDDLLPKGNFDISYNLLPWRNFTKNEYILNTEIRSFGNETSQNTINNIVIYPLPTQWLSTWRLEDSISESAVNPVSITNVKKYGTWLYSIEMNASGNGVVALSQGYNSGWNSWPRMEQVKVNGWANGWIVNKDTKHMTIYYWPQLLQFGGFAMLGIATAYWFYRWIFRSKLG